jgi:polysaccharide biosynthesis/export protein
VDQYKLKALALAAFMLFAGSFAICELARANTAIVRLVAGDRLNVTVFGQNDLSGVFQVDGEGNIELPLVGTIPVGNITLKEAEKRIEARLADGYLRQPSVSVRITELRPIYVVGDVRSPGAFPFRHGSSVLSAIAQAGGYGRAEGQLSAAIADFLLADERLRVLENTQRVLLIRQARLEAQRNGETTFTASVPPELSDQVIAAYAGERDALKVQSEELQRELDLWRKQQPRLESAAAAIEEQLVSERKHFELVRGQLVDLAKLQAMGLARRPAEVALQREQATVDSNMSRYRSELARLSVTIGEIEIKIQDVEHSYRRRVLAELQEVRTKLQDIETALPTVREVREVRLQQTGNATATEAAEPMHRIVITRTTYNAAKAFDATDETLLEPGDIVEVKRLRQEAHSSTSALVGPQSKSGAGLLADTRKE